MTIENRDGLTRWLAEEAGANTVHILDSGKLDGGAIQDNRFLGLSFEGGPLDGPQKLVLRRSSPGTVEASHDRATEFALLKVAFDAGVRVPEPLFLNTGESLIGGEFFIMRALPGIGLGPKIVKDTSIGGDRDRLACDLATEMAKIHRITPEKLAPGLLGPPPTDPALNLVATYHEWLDSLTVQRPVLAWALYWLRENAPDPEDVVLCHRDFRTGNYLVDESGLTGILDWEFAGWGDPCEDLGWFSCRFWRFGATQLDAGGISTNDRFHAAYEKASGRTLDPARIRYYEVMANLRWAIIALQQAGRFTSGAEDGLELALISRRVPEMEAEIIALTRDTS